MSEAADNSGQRAFWSGNSGTSWIAHETRQDALLENVARAVLDRAALRQGERVTDIGCGTGRVSEMAAERVSDTGFVLATDISEPLLARAAERLARHRHVTTGLGDAATMDWPAPPFDAAISRFGVMFFADPAGAFRNIARALRPGGRMVFATWGPVSENPYWSLGASAAGQVLGTLPKTPANAPGPMGLSDPAYARTCLEDAGLRNVLVTPTPLALAFPGSVEDLADLMVELGPARRAINAFEANRTDIATIRQMLAQNLRPFEQADQSVSLPAEINVITALRM